MEDTKQQAYGFIHCHSDHSLKDSPLLIKNLVQGAVDLGAKAITLTDHGTCTGIFEFMDTCKEKGIKGIPGVEAYVETEYGKRSHLILLAKNYQGYQEICRAVTMSNENIEYAGLNAFPRMNKEILEKCFVSGNVIATSACVSGVFANILLYNHFIERQKEKFSIKANRFSEKEDETYNEDVKTRDAYDKQIADLMVKRDEIEALANKSYLKRKKGLQTLVNDKELYEQTKAKLEEEMAETEKAKEILPNIKKELADTRRKRTIINQKCTKSHKAHLKYIEYKDRLHEMSAKAITEDDAKDIVRKEVQWYLDIFKGNFYMEMQYHGMEDEKYVMNILLDVAKEFNIPLVAANDVHIQKQSDAEARQIMRSLRYAKYEEISEYDKELYLKDDKTLSEWLLKILPEDAVKEAIDNVKIVCDSCNVVIPDVSHYPKYIGDDGDVVKDAPALLRKLTIDGISKRYKEGEFTPEHQKRMEYELDVIISLGYADYLLIVMDYIQYARSLAKELGNGVGYGIGPGRGSGAGSLVNYLLGITMIEPLTYGLIFERFLNKDRVSMPDIDTDFSDEVREKTIQYVSHKYGEDCVAGIRTNITQASKLAVKNTGRFMSWQYPDKKDYYVGLSNTLAGEIEDDIASCVNDVYRKHPSDDTANILNKAQLIEGTTTSLGVHAAGIIIGDGEPLSNYVPLLYNKKKQQWAVQCDMGEAEGSLKLLKMDFLGLNNLDIITECLRRIQRNTGENIDIDNLPFEDEVFAEIFSTGKTGCVFQFESGGMKQMLKQFQPESFEDIILLVAAYRPGPMDSIPAIIDVKHGRKKTHYKIKGLEEILAPTYGQTIYQEQLMDICHKCAGFTMGEADIIRKYMSKKKVDKFLAYKPRFVQGVINNGASEEDANELWDSLVGFAKYAFNKSHAAAYSMISYQTAYLKYHYPAEYMCAVLNHTDIKKLPTYLDECKKMGIKVTAPDINESSEKFEDKGDCIFYGLAPIKGVSNSSKMIVAERQENGFYLSFSDFLQRTKVDKGTIEVLISAGCFERTIPNQRKALLEHLPTFLSYTKLISKKEKQIEEYDIALIETKGNSKERRSLLKRKENAINSIAQAKDKITKIDLSKEELDEQIEALKLERELLGAYVSGHPLDAYRSLFNSDAITTVSDFKVGYGDYAGIITDMRIAQRKSDKADMAFFTLEDITGTIDVCCFAENYAKYKHLIKEGEIVRIYALAVEEESFKNENETENKLVVQAVKKCRPRRKPVLISYKDDNTYQNVLRGILDFHQNADGRNVILHNSSTGEVVNTDIYLNDAIIKQLMSVDRDSETAKSNPYYYLFAQILDI